MGEGERRSEWEKRRRGEMRENRGAEV